MLFNIMLFILNTKNVEPSFEVIKDISSEEMDQILNEDDFEDVVVESEKLTASNSKTEEKGLKQNLTGDNEASNISTIPIRSLKEEPLVNNSNQVSKENILPTKVGDHFINVDGEPSHEADVTSAKAGDVIPNVDGASSQEAGLTPTADVVSTKVGDLISQNLITSSQATDYLTSTKVGDVISNVDGVSSQEAGLISSSSTIFESSFPPNVNFSSLSSQEDDFQSLNTDITSNQQITQTKTENSQVKNINNINPTSESENQDFYSATSTDYDENSISIFSYFNPVQLYNNIAAYLTKGYNYITGIITKTDPLSKDERARLSSSTLKSFSKVKNTSNQSRTTQIFIKKFRNIITEDQIHINSPYPFEVSNKNLSRDTSTDKVMLNHMYATTLAHFIENPALVRTEDFPKDKIIHVIIPTVYKNTSAQNILQLPFVNRSSIEDIFKEFDALSDKHYFNKSRLINRSLKLSSTPCVYDLCKSKKCCTFKFKDFFNNGYTLHDVNVAKEMVGFLIFDGSNLLFYCFDISKLVYVYYGEGCAYYFKHDNICYYLNICPIMVKCYIKTIHSLNMKDMVDERVGNWPIINVMGSTSKFYTKLESSAKINNSRIGHLNINENILNAVSSTEERYNEAIRIVKGGKSKFETCMRMLKDLNNNYEIGPVDHYEMETDVKDPDKLNQFMSSDYQWIDMEDDKSDLSDIPRINVKRSKLIINDGVDCKGKDLDKKSKTGGIIKKVFYIVLCSGVIVCVGVLVYNFIIIKLLK